MLKVEVGAVILICAFTHALWNAWLRGGSDRLRIRTVMVLLSSAVCFVALPFLPQPTAEAWPFIGLAVCGHLFYNLCLIRMYREGDLTQTYPLAHAMQPLLVTIGSAVLIAELPSPMAMSGIAIVSCGLLLLVNLDGMWTAAGRFALLTGGIIGVNNVVSGIGVRATPAEFVSYACWIVALNGVTLGIAYVCLRRNLRLWPMSGKDAFAAIVGGLLATAAFGAAIWTMLHGPLGALAALREANVIFALVFGTILLKESLTLRKIAAALLILLGALLAFFGGNPDAV